MKIGVIVGFSQPKAGVKKTTGEAYTAINISVTYSDPFFEGVKAETAFLYVNPDESSYQSYKWLSVGAKCIIVHGGYQGSISDILPADQDKLFDVLAALC